MSYQALLYCPDEKTARVVTQVLTELEFSVELSNEPFATVKKLMAKQYDAIVVDCDNEQNAALLFKSARNSTSNQSSLAVAVVEGQAGVAKAFRIGANLVLTKPVNIEQSKGTLRVARGLLKKAESGKTAAGAATTLSPAPPRAFTPNLNPTAAITSPPAHIVGSASGPFASSGSSAKMGGIPVPRSSATFEIEEEPTAKPEPTEAAFLQSISEVPKAQKDTPWMQISQPPAATHGPTSAVMPGSRATAGTLHPTRRPFGVGTTSGQAAATAPAKEPTFLAPVKESSKPVVTAKPVMRDETETKTARTAAITVPEFTRPETSEEFSPASAPSESKSSRLPFVAAIAVIAVAGAGYFGWTSMHKPATAVPVQASVQNVAPGNPESVPATGQTPPADDSFAQSSKPETSVELQKNSVQPLPKLNESQPVEQRSTRHVTGAPAPDEIVVVENGSSQSGDSKPVSVKRKSADPLPVRSESVEVGEVTAPPALQAQASAADQTIAGLITTNYTSIPRNGSQPLRVSQGITEGMLVKKVSPVYPARALQLHIQGTVEILASISKTGSISSVKQIRGDATLGGAALTAVKQWKYKPYTLNGQAVDVQTQIVVNFKLP